MIQMLLKCVKVSSKFENERFMFSTLNSPLLATFYTLSFIEYIHDATHLLRQLTYIPLAASH